MCRKGTAATAALIARSVAARGPWRPSAELRSAPALLLASERGVLRAFRAWRLSESAKTVFATTFARTTALENWHTSCARTSMRIAPTRARPCVRMQLTAARQRSASSDEQNKQRWFSSVADLSPQRKLTQIFRPQKRNPNIVFMADWRTMLLAGCYCIAQWGSGEGSRGAAFVLQSARAEPHSSSGTGCVCLQSRQVASGLAETA
jgi:hypothetical protein